VYKRVRTKQGLSGGGCFEKDWGGSGVVQEKKTAKKYP